MNEHLKKLAIILAATYSAGVTAEQIDLEISIDLTQGTLLGNGGGVYDAYGIAALEYFDASVLVSEGDSVNLSITFVNGQVLGFENVAYDNLLFPWLHPDFDLSEPGASNFTIDNSEVVIYGVDGSVTDRIYGGLENSGNAHLGPYLEGAFASGSSRFISAIEVSYDVVHLQTQSYFYSGVNFQIFRGGTTIFTDLAEIVEIDIKPDSHINCFNANGHGVIPVAVLGGDSFDVTNIDQSTLSFGGLEVRVRGNRGPLCNLDDTNDDGFYDLVCHFEDNTDYWEPGEDEASLTGELFDGTRIKGTDSICIVP